MKIILKLILYMIAFTCFPFELAIWLICLLFGIKLYKKGIKKTTYNGFLLWILFNNNV